jgi:hypothetical protein
MRAQWFRPRGGQWHFIEDGVAACDRATKPSGARLTLEPRTRPPDFDSVCSACIASCWGIRTEFDRAVAAHVS